MSFLKEFKEELSQAVNELVNADDNNIGYKKEKSKEEMARKKKKEKVEKVEKAEKVEQVEKAGQENSGTVENTDNIPDSDNGDKIKYEEVNEETLVAAGMDNTENMDAEDNTENMVGAENTDGEENADSGVNTEAEKDLDVVNVDMEVLNELFGNSDLSEEKEVEKIMNEINEENISMDDEFMNMNNGSEENSDIIKELARNIQSKINDDKLEEMMEDDKESKKAALRGGKYEEESNNYFEEETSLATEEIAEITKGTMIEGNIVSEGSINLYGKIKGNVSCRGKLVVCGTIAGSSRGAEIFTNNAKIDGDVTSDGSIKVGNGSVIIGNVYGTSAVIAGAVKGDIDVQGPVIIDGTAVIQGNIRSRTVQINNGAAIEGMISQCYAEVDYNALFDKTFIK